MTKPRVLFPVLSSDEIEAIAKGHFYVHNLVCLKLIFGNHMGMGVVTDSGGHRYCKSVFDLWIEGFCSARWLWLDEYLECLEPIKYLERRHQRDVMQRRQSRRELR